MLKPVTILNYSTVQSATFSLQLYATYVPLAEAVINFSSHVGTKKWWTANLVILPILDALLTILLFFMHTSCNHGNVVPPIIW